MFYFFVLTLILGECLLKVNGQCGDKVQVLLKPFQETVIKSPDSGDGSYPPNTTCSWVIQKSSEVPPDMKVLVKIEEKGLQCPGDYLRLYEGGSTEGPKIFDEFSCIPYRNRTEVYVISGFSYAEFKTDDDDKTGPGFQMTFLPTNSMSGNGCSSTEYLLADETERFLTSPGFPDDFPLNSVCNWNITANGSDTVEIVLYLLDVDESDNCTFHYLEISRDGESTVLCDKGSWEKRTFSGFEILISFKTDARNRMKGFLIGYKSGVTNSTTPTTVVTDTPTLSPDYFDWLYTDYYKLFPDYYYYDSWNSPIETTTWPQITPSVPAIVPTTTPMPVATTVQIPQSGNWMFPNWLYLSYFFT